MKLKNQPARGYTRAIRKQVERPDGTKATIFVASTADADRSDDIIDQASWKLANYSLNPVVLVDHDYEVSKIVASGKAALEGGDLTLEIVKWADTPRALEAKSLVEAELLNAVSVGFRPGKASWRRNLASDHPAFKAEGYGLFYEDCELLEVSLVAVPCNPNALAKTLDSETIEDLVSRAVAKALQVKADNDANAVLDDNTPLETLFAATKAAQSEVNDSTPLDTLFDKENA